MSTGEISDSQRLPSLETQDDKRAIMLFELIDILRRREESPIICKVPRRLRKANEGAYIPNAISIGPYHHGKEHLNDMEDIKKSFYDRNEEDSKEKLQAAISEYEERIRACYVQIDGLSPEKLVEMVVLDGYFIVQLFMGISHVGLLLQRHILTEVAYDLLLLENQLPFFVLVKIHEIIIRKEETKENFTDLALEFFEDLAVVSDTRSCLYSKGSIKHLLGLIHDNRRWRPSDGSEKEEQETENQSKTPKCGWKFISCTRKQDHETGEKAKGKSATDLKIARTNDERREEEEEEHNNGNEDRTKKDKCRWKLPCARSEPGKKPKGADLFIRCATELDEAGISFERRDEKKEKCTALDIDFKFGWRDAKLRIPKIRVDGSSELVLLNLIAFEQCLPNWKSTYVIDYIIFLDNLINSELDVQLLCRSGIIENLLGDYEAVARVFNRLGDRTYVSSDFYYSAIFEQVNEHCNSQCKKDMVYLHRNYFNSPWALLSFLAALLLLLLTFSQTMFQLLTVHCHSCEVLFIVCGVILGVIGLVVSFCFG